MSPESAAGSEAKPFFETVLVSETTPSAKAFAGLAIMIFLTVLYVENSCGRVGAGLCLIAAAFAPLLCYLAYQLCGDPQPCPTEHISIDGVAVRVSHYVEDKLVEQRRVKLADLAIELREDADHNCYMIQLRSGRAARIVGRAIEIAHSLDPTERRLFFERFLEGLRKSGADPEIRVISAAR